MKRIAWFEELGRESIKTVGGKGANLGEMVKSGFPVPNGFAVTVDAFFEFLEKRKLKQKIVEIIDSIDVENTQELEQKSKQVRDMIKQETLPEETANEIIKAYSKLAEKEKVGWLTSSEQPFVAVRSSATAEDLPEASFAGQQETFLNVLGKENLLNSVKNCYASLYTPRAVYYRKKHGFKTEQVGLSAIVQKMVNAETAGIMFTAEPTGDKTKIVIEAVFGLGEPIVAGAVTPDNYVVDKNSMKIVRKKVNKQKWLVLKEGSKSVKKNLNPEQSETQKIPDDTIIALAKIGNKIEQHYNVPQDIEWAVEKGRIMIVQTRPITTLALNEKMKEMQQIEETPVLKGAPGSPGIVSGKVKIVLDIENISKIEKDDILVTRMTSPDWVPVMKKSKAIVTNEGGRTCHAAIVSRELGIPCIVGTDTATKILKDNQIVTVNGFTGKIYDGEIKIAAPEKKETKVIEEKEFDSFEKVLKEKTEKEKVSGAGLFGMADEIKQERETEKRRKEEIEHLQSEKEAEQILKKFGEKKTSRLTDEEKEKEKKLIEKTLSKISPKVKVNVALADVAEKASQTGAEGVGLLRAEHMITSSGKHPAEFLKQGQEEKLKNIVKSGIKAVAGHFSGKPVWFRTFDARSDEFRNLKGGENEPKEDNPMLGWHGIRRDLDQPEMLKIQFEAVKELYDEGIKNVGIMLPFVTHAEQIKKAKQLAKEAELDLSKIDFGIMIETPASIWIIDELIEEGIDFVSFGTNDLTQLTLGLDRNNELVQKHFNELHPAIMRSIKHVIKKCREKNVRTSICGQAASNPEMVKQLVKMGISSVSANIDAVEEIKKIVMLEEKNILMEK